MCGILGWLGEGINFHYSKFDKAIDILSHRGPDNRGIWQDKDILLGHRRLSIIDLSESGNQPMIDKKSGSTIIFNGEIYNYLELKKDLISLGYNFHGSSDTEVLLYSLIEWGPEVLPRLNGMWAFAFWSQKKNQLILSRDRFGVKPLYLYNFKNNFAFASEPKALLKLFPQNRSIDENTFLDFLGNNLLYTKGQSFYKGISVFPNAHYCIYEPNNKNLKFIRYWDYPKDVRHNQTEKEAIEEFSFLLQDSVNLRLRSDVPVGLSLSGGLDSTSILAAANLKKKKPINCLTSVYDENFFDEFKWAKNACMNSKSNLITVKSYQKNWLNSLKNIVWYMDAPGYSPAVYPMWNLTKLSRQEKIPVLLDGQGADESLAGYTQYKIQNIFENFNKNKKKSNTKIFINQLRSLVDILGLVKSIAFLFREIFPSLHLLYRKKIGFQSLMLNEVTIPRDVTNDNKNCTLRERLIKDHSLNILPGLLHYGDAISMANSIEVRNPFLDYRLVEWVFKLPNNLLFNRNESKWVIREYLRINNQKLIGNRKDKKGYLTPVKKWLVSSEVKNFILSDNNPMFQWCDKKKVKKLLHLNDKGVIGTEHNLYKLLSSQLWIQECIKK